MSKFFLSCLLSLGDQVASADSSELSDVEVLEIEAAGEAAIRETRILGFLILDVVELVLACLRALEVERVDAQRLRKRA